ADDDFPVAARAFDQFRFLVRRCIHRTATLYSLRSSSGKCARSSAPVIQPPWIFSTSVTRFPRPSQVLTTRVGGGAGCPARGTDMRAAFRLWTRTDRAG